MRRKFSAEEKMAIVLEGLRGKKTIAEICREHGISQGQYYKWRDKFLEGAKTALETSGNSSQAAQYQRKIQELEQIIGKQAIVIETLKKTIIHPGGK
jgi:putative transposase